MKRQYTYLTKIYCLFYNQQLCNNFVTLKKRWPAKINIMGCNEARDQLFWPYKNIGHPTTVGKIQPRSIKRHIQNASFNSLSVSIV